MRQRNILIIPFLCFIFLFEAGVQVQALTRDDAVDTFSMANKEYNAGQKAMAEKREGEAAERFEHAVQLYERLIESGFINGQIYYNTGNAYYRLGMSGKAIIYYRRAEKLLPRDANIRANISLLKRDFRDKESIRQLPEIIKVVCFWYFFLNLNEITLLAVYMYLALMVSILSFIFIRFQWIKKLIIILGSCLLVLVISLGIKVYNQHSIERGVIIAGECKIRYGPGKEYEPKFEIHEGAEVKIEGRKDKWFKVYVYVDLEDIREDEDKKEVEFRIGWLPEAEVGKI